MAFREVSMNKIREVLRVCPATTMSALSMTG